MREVIATPKVSIPLGRQGENEAVQVKFPICKWEELYGAGSFELLNSRPGENMPYPCNITVDDDFVYWVVQAADVAIVGHGQCELTYVVSGTIAKSIIFGTCVLKSIEGSGTVPAPYEARIADLIDAATSIKEDVKSDEDHRRHAEVSAEEAAAAALLAKSWAVGETNVREGEDINNAYFWARVAQQGAGKSGYAYFYIDDETGELIVTVAYDLDEDVRFEINEEEGTLEVIFA